MGRKKATRGALNTACAPKMLPCCSQRSLLARIWSPNANLRQHIRGASIERKPEPKGQHGRVVRNRACFLSHFDLLLIKFRTPSGMKGCAQHTEKDWDETVSFLRWAKPDIIRAGLLCPLPGTSLFNQLPADMRDSIRWEDYTYLDTLELGLIMSSLPEEKVRSRYRNLNKYFLGPHIAWGMLRDSSPDEREFRRALWKKLISFALRHPLRAARLPCRWAD